MTILLACVAQRTQLVLLLLGFNSVPFVDTSETTKRISNSTGLDRVVLDTVNRHFDSDTAWFGASLDTDIGISSAYPIRLEGDFSIQAWVRPTDDTERPVFEIGIVLLSDGIRLTSMSLNLNNVEVARNSAIRWL
jgi:hypothetical protein